MSDARKRLSGYQYRKRRKEKESNLSKQTGALDLFVKRKNTEGTSTSTCFEARINDTLDTSITDRNDPITPEISCPLSPEILTQPNQTHNQSEDTEDASMIETVASSIATNANDSDASNVDVDIIDPEDPAKWLINLSDADRTLIVKNGPPAPLLKYNFPTDDRGRKFTAFYYDRVLSNGEKVRRNWLTYSRSVNAVFCVCCKLFDLVKKSSLSSEGFNDWSHLGETLKQHEVSKTHLKAGTSYAELSLRLKSNQTIDTGMQRVIDAETKHWHGVLMRIISIIQCLAESCLALRGSSDRLYEHENGNFLKYIQLLSKFDPVMNEHVRRVLTQEEKRSHYLGKNIQNEVIDLIFTQIQSVIISRILKAKYYSIILDCTPDISKVEQMTIILRSVYYCYYYCSTFCVLMVHFFIGMFISTKTVVILNQKSAKVS